MNGGLNKIILVTDSNRSALSFSIDAVSRVKDICKPLQTYLGINCFRYLKIYPDCSYLGLINGYEEYQKKYSDNVRTLDKQLVATFKESLINEPKFFLWPTKYKKLTTLLSLHNEFNIWQGFSIYYRSIDYIETFTFTFNKNADDKSKFYAQNSQLLMKFCEYFKNKAADLIKKDKAKLAVYEDKFDLSYTGTTDKNRNQFLLEINNFSDFLIADRNGKIVKLTQRELQCLELISAGLTIKSTAQKLSLSPRTIETHINHIKDKAGVHYKPDLIKLYRDKIIV